MLKGIFSKNRNNQKKKIVITDINKNSVPEHVAIIMDGNGRWAKRKGLPRIAGHRAGMKAIKNAVKIADQLGVKILTLYAFSTENWNRPEDEVKFLMALPQEFLAKEIDELVQNNVKVKVMGFLEKIPEHTLQAVMEAERQTKNNTGLILNFALNYGSRNEIIHATKLIVDDVISGKIDRDHINEQTFRNYLLTNQYPDPDLLIRTSGEKRISNFLLWQLAYAELWFTPVYWPDFNKEFFLEAIYDFQNRKRRFGGL